MSPWRMTGSLLDQRGGHAANLLLDGTVLISGGYDDQLSVTLRSCELYTPASGSFGSTAPMCYKRAGHTTTIMPNGTVLAVGGNEAPVTEIYFPGPCAEWVVAGQMIQARGGQAAAILPSGGVLVCGGYDPVSYAVFATAEEFDPTTQSWAPVGAMARRRSGHTATPLTDGRVLIVGGGEPSGTVLPSVEVYDPQTKTFSVPPNAPAVGRVGHTATRLADGRVLIAGGEATTFAPISTSLASCEIYDAGAWSIVGNLTTGRRSHDACLTRNGKVLVSGGLGAYTHTESYEVLSSAELFDPTTLSWTATASMSARRTGHTQTLLAESGFSAITRAETMILVTGGGVQTLATAEIYESGYIIPPGPTEAA